MVTNDYSDVADFNHSVENVDGMSYLKAFILFRQMQNVRVRIPQIQVCEKKGGNSLAKIKGEWFRITEEVSQISCSHKIEVWSTLSFKEIREQILLNFRILTQFFKNVNRFYHNLSTFSQNFH